MVYANGNLYFNGRIKGKTGNELTLGGKAVSVTNDCENLLLASVSAADLSVGYVKTITPVGSKKTIHNNGCQWIDGYVYFTGSSMGGLTGLYENSKDSTRATSSRWTQPQARWSRAPYAWMAA